MRIPLACGASLCALLLIPACRLNRQSDNPMGPNAACYVCHISFVGEELVSVHLKAKIGCTACHGLSAAHANDEKVGATKPDVLIKGDDIAGFCRACHPQHNAPPDKVIERWLERGGAIALSQPTSASLTCTFCHGNHKIAKSQS
jgi:hypothetical protein